MIRTTVFTLSILQKAVVLCLELLIAFYGLSVIIKPLHKYHLYLVDNYFYITHLAAFTVGATAAIITIAHLIRIIKQLFKNDSN